MRDYDHMPVAEGAAPVTSACCPPPPGTPPAGVHIPPPSFRPILVSLAAALLVAGLVVGGWLLVAGFIALTITLLGWLWDARKEYVATEEADRTGHLDGGRRPPWPKAAFAALAVLVVVGVVLGSGLIGGWRRRGVRERRPAGQRRPGCGASGVRAAGSGPRCGRDRDRAQHRLDRADAHGPGRHAVHARRSTTRTPACPTTS